MLIGEFSKKVNVSEDTLRFYEKKGLFSKKRTISGYRTYNYDDFETVKIIAAGKAMGFSLQEILHFSRAVTSGSLNQARVKQNLQIKIDAIDAQIASLKEAKKFIQKKMLNCEALTNIKLRDKK